MRKSNLSKASLAEKAAGCFFSFLFVVLLGYEKSKVSSGQFK